MRKEFNGIRGFIENANPFILIGLVVLLLFISTMIAVNGFADLVKTVINQWIDASVAYWISVTLTGLSIVSIINRSYLVLISRSNDIVDFMWSILPILLFMLIWQIASGSLYEIYKAFDSPTNVQMTFYVVCKISSGFLKIFMFLVACVKLYSGVAYLFNRR